MPPEPIEERVFAAVAARLASIQAGSLYWSTPALVTRSLLWIDQYAEALRTGPVLGVVRSSRNSLLQIALPATFEHGLRVRLWGYVLGDATTVAGTKLARLRADTLRCLLADDTLGGLVRDCRPDPEGRMDTDDGELEPEGWFAETWLITADEDF